MWVESVVRLIGETIIISSPNWGATPAGGSMPPDLISIAPDAYAGWVSGVTDRRDEYRGDTYQSGVTLGETRVLLNLNGGERIRLYRSS